MILPNYQSLSLAEVKSKITRLTDLGKPEQDFLFATITDWQQDKKRELMLTGQKYYRNENDITERKRYYIDRKGNKQEVQNLSNSKLAHPFMRKLTNQKVNYLLSKDFTINCEDETLLEQLSTYLGTKFKRILKSVGRDAIVNGIAWLQVFYDKDGILSFKRIPSEEIIPFWFDAEHTQLEGIVRVYTILKFSKNGAKKEINKIEYHTLQGVWYYEMNDHGLIPDPEMGDKARGHFIVEEQKMDSTQRPMFDKVGNPITVDTEAVWDKVPFIAFKYNSDEISLVKWVKPLIDDYDTNTSDTSNNLQDVPNSIKVVRNYDGTDKGEFVQNLATFRTAFVSNDGDMTTLNTPLDVTAIDSHLNRLKKDIYDAGNGVDTHDEDLGNASGVALKFRYAGLDMDTQYMANEFKASLDELLWFIKVDMATKGIGDYMDTDVEIVFNTDIIVNESEVITDAKNSVGIISDETIVANHPWVMDAQAEQERLKKQKEEALAELQAAMLPAEEFDNNNGNEFGSEE